VGKNHQKKILVAPLNWGLGHASRCVPIIQCLIDHGAEVIIGAEEHPKALLEQEFPQLEFVELPGYDITYPSGGNMAVHMLKIMPKILNGIKKEHQQLEALIKAKGLDGVISDNRFGLHTDLVPTVFITHQVMIKAPYGETILQRLNRRFINKFKTCWIPDFEGENNLSGDLAHKYPLPEHGRFVGTLSRFEPQEADIEYDVIGIISGPEPQRTMFQHIVTTEFEINNVRALLVLGKAGREIEDTIEKIEIKSHLTAKALQEAIAKSKMVVCRSGYSSLMDLAAMGKPAILVPTPGQTEQEYLANYHLEKKHYYSIEQDRYDLDEALEAAKEFSGINTSPDDDLLDEAVVEFLSSC